MAALALPGDSLNTITDSRSGRFLCWGQGSYKRPGERSQARRNATAGEGNDTGSSSDDKKR